MRRESLLGIGFLLVATGEVVRAAIAYVDGAWTGATLAFAAAAGALLVSAGYFWLKDAPWAVPVGLSVAALAHVGALALRLPEVVADLATLAGVAIVVGFALAAWAATGEAARATWFRVGMGAVALGGVLAAGADVQAGAAVAIVGDAFFLVGAALAAGVAALPDAALEGRTLPE